MRHGARGRERGCEGERQDGAPHGTFRNSASGLQSGNLGFLLVKRGNAVHTTLAILNRGGHAWKSMFARSWVKAWLSIDRQILYYFWSGGRGALNSGGALNLGFWARG